MVEHAVGLARQILVQHRRKLVAPQECIAPEEGLLFGKARELREALGPACRAISPVAAGRRQNVHQWLDQAAAQKRRQPTIARRKHACVVTTVAGEQLVRAHARQQHLDAKIARSLADEIGVDRRAVADRLVERAHHLRQHFREIRTDDDLVQIDAGCLRERSRVAEVVWHRLEFLILGPERDREAIEPINLLARRAR